MTFSQGRDKFTAKLISSTLLPVFLLVFVSTAVYLNSLSHGFVFDDMGTIVENKYISDLSNNFPLFFTKEYFKIAGNETSYRPLATLSYYLVYAIAGLNPFFYHLLSVLLHTVNVVLVYLLGTLILKHRLTALIAVLMFACHPVLTEAVNCISYNEDLLAAVFFLLAFLFYLKSPTNGLKPGRKNYVISPFFFMLALFSKEMAITLPAVILLYDVVLRDAERGPITIKPLLTILKSRAYFYSGYVAVSLFYIFLRFHVFYNQEELSVHSYGNLFDRIIFLPQHIVAYLKIVFFPLNLSAHYVFSYPTSFFEISNIISFLILAGLMVASFFILHKNND